MDSEQIQTNNIKKKQIKKEGFMQGVITVMFSQV